MKTQTEEKIFCGAKDCPYCKNKRELTSREIAQAMPFVAKKLLDVLICDGQLRSRIARARQQREEKERLRDSLANVQEDVAKKEDLNFREAKDLLQANEDDIRKVIKRGILPSRKVQGKIVISKSSLVDLVISATGPYDPKLPYPLWKQLHDHSEDILAALTAPPS